MNISAPPPMAMLQYALQGVAPDVARRVVVDFMGWSRLRFVMRRLACLFGAAIFLMVLLCAHPQAQTIVFQETFGSAAGQLPTTLSDADGTYSNPACRNGIIRLPSSPLDPSITAHLYQNTGSCSYGRSQRVWYNASPITVLPNTVYRYSYRSISTGTNPAILLQHINVVSVGSIVIDPEVILPINTNNWRERYIEFVTGPGTTSVNLSLTNNRTTAAGNDFGLDDIVLYALTSGMTLQKRGTLNDTNGNGFVDPGETINYEFEVKNTGTLQLTGVTVVDPLLAVNQGPQVLAAGASFTFTAQYTAMGSDIEAGSVSNTAKATGSSLGGPVESLPATVVVPAPPATLDLQKDAVFEDVDGDGLASIGDALRYTLLVTNTGGRTASNVSPIDPGPTFDGRPAVGSLSVFVPSPVSLAPGDTATFTTSYILTQPDIDNAAGIEDGISNIALAQGLANGGTVLSNDATALLSMPMAPPPVIGLTKVALLRQILRGQEAPFAITVSNNAPTPASGLRVVDTVPSGFRYVDGSATVGGIAVTPVVEGRQVIFDNLSVPGNSVLEIRLRMLALSSAGPGQHINRASVADAAGTMLAPDATAMVEIAIEPVFDCSEIIGRVFEDTNRNGDQEDGELGLPGVRLATVNGWLVTTDAHGRFHVACAALPDQRIGSNFIMKLDQRTLPTGYRLTTENPVIVRLTAGKMTSLDFGAAIGRVVKLDLMDGAFEPGAVRLRPQWRQGIEQLLAVLAQEQSVLRLSYLEPGANPDTARARLQAVADAIRERWEQSGIQYRLDIETRLEVGP